MRHIYAFGWRAVLFLTARIKLWKAQCISLHCFHSFPLHSTMFSKHVSQLSTFSYCSCLVSVTSLQGAAFTSAHPAACTGWGREGHPGDPLPSCGRCGGVNPPARAQTTPSGTASLPSTRCSCQAPGSVPKLQRPRLPPSHLCFSPAWEGSLSFRRRMQGEGRGWGVAPLPALR